MIFGKTGNTGHLIYGNMLFKMVPNIEQNGLYVVFQHICYRIIVTWFQKTGK